MMRRLIPLVLLLLVGGCGYFNSLYNANRRYAEGERASRRGDQAGANRAYADAIEKAAVSFRRYPDGRWADDALLLIGRARFALAADRATIAAMRSVLERTPDDDVRAIAHAYLGAALVRSDSIGGSVHLDSAVARLDAGNRLGAFARLWRARALFAAQGHAAAFRDLDAIAGNRALAFEASLLAARQAARLHDSTHFRAAIGNLARAPFTGVVPDPVVALLDSAAAVWSPRAVFAGSEPLERAAWSAPLVDAVTVTRARIALAAADTVSALRLASDVAERAAQGGGDAARLLAARLRLRAATTPEELETVRQYLLSAFADPDALTLQRQIKAAQILLLRGRSGPASALSLFAAAEMIRDHVGAPLVARHVFLEYAALVPDASWSGKALLAAHMIAPDAATSAALARATANVYVAAVNDPSRSAAVGPEEERLARGLEGLEEEALAEAVLRDVVVGRAVTVLDSTRVAARSDSIRISCGTLLDSLRITGIRADSTRSACLRGDSARVGFVLRNDTIVLLDSAAARAVRTPGRPVRPDTTLFRT